MTDLSREAELLPCPFCGGESHIGTVRYSSPLEDIWWEDGSKIVEAFYGHCARCAAGHRNSFSGGHQTHEKAIAAWNTRPSTAPAMTREAVIEALWPVFRENNADRMPGMFDDAPTWARVLISAFADAILPLLSAAKAEGLEEAALTIKKLADIAAFLSNDPPNVTYDVSAKTYVLKENDND